MEIELNGSPEDVTRLLFGGDVVESKPNFNTIISFKRVGSAGLSKTQEFLQKKSPTWRPDWYWAMVENRPSWRNATDHQVHFHSVSLVTDPLPELEFGKGIPFPKVVSVGFTTE